MARRFERLIIVSIAFMCGWFSATNFSFFAQLSDDSMHLRSGPLHHINTAKALAIAKKKFKYDSNGRREPAMNKVSQVRFDTFSNEETMTTTGTGTRTSTSSRIPFPNSIKNETWESILHPAIQMSTQKNDEPDENHQMKVPKFWNPPLSGSNGNGETVTDVRAFLGNYGAQIMTPEQTSRVGSFAPRKKDYDLKAGDAKLRVKVSNVSEPNNSEESLEIIVNDDKYELPPDDGHVQLLETIYVSIASYRDYRCPHTVQQLFRQATYPERIRVGIVDQLDPQEDDSCTTPTRGPCEEHPHDPLCQYAHQIDSYEMDAKLGVGPVFARHIGHRMYRGEYFVLQSDAHMEFVKGWDEDIINQWKSAQNEMAVLTTYVSEVMDHYNNVTGVSDSTARPIMCETDFEPDYYNDRLSFLMHGQQPEGDPAIHGEPTLHPLWAAGFSFARGHFAVNVPYDQYLPMIFQGEEISITIRAFTYGYDFYAPERSILFHYYSHDPNHKKRKIATFWENAENYDGVESASKARLLGIIHMFCPISSEGETTDTENEEQEAEATDNREEGTEKKEEANEGEEKETDEEEGQEPTTPIEWNQIEEKKYGIGQIRSVQKYMDTFGIRLDEKKVEKHLCRFVGKPMNTIFLRQMRSDGMGIDYSKIQYQFKDPEINGVTWKELMKQ